MISPILSNGIIAQTQNVNAINHGEENKGQVTYQHTQATLDTREQEMHSTVVASQDSSKTSTKHDAREEGKNKYMNNRKAGVKKKPEDSDGVVVKKGGGGFSISI